MFKKDNNYLVKILPKHVGYFDIIIFYSVQELEFIL